MMNAHPPSTSATRVDDRDWLDTLLVADARDHATHYIDDDGFTASVMRRLPAPATLPAWRRPAVIALWLAAAALLAVVLPETLQDLAREAVALVAAKPVSLSMLGMLLGALGLATWTGAALALSRY